MSDAGRPQDNRHSPALVWRRIRISVQIIAFIAFLYLLIGLNNNGNLLLPHHLFFVFDPLAGIMATIGGREFIPVMAFGLLTLVLTLFLGRAWCGWVCPMGTVLDWTKGGRGKRLPGRDSAWQTVKYGLLFAVLLGSAFGTLTLAFLDPITLLYRSLASAVLPVINALITNTETLLYGFEPLRGSLDVSDAFFRSVIMPVSQPVYAASILIGLLFAAVLALNVVKPRFWCRYLCPLGALLGLVSRVSIFRITARETECTSCGRCARDCPMGAIKSEPDLVVQTSECTLCLDCMVKCRADAMSFAYHAPTALAYEPSRRQFITASGLALVAGGLLRLPSFIRGDKRLLVRPPGATEDSLRGLCIRCNQCVKVCPTGGLQPSVMPEGLDQLWTPTLVSRVGYCDYSCNACGQTCPTGAIEPLTLEAKRREVIGLARIDEDRCIPFVENRDCIVCEEMCPTPEKAIVLDDVVVTGKDGRPVTVRRPRVIHQLCIGCGICEYKCPVEGPSAIVVEPSEPEGRQGGSGNGQGFGRGNGGGRNAA
ncbi:MAG: 4Fe-4S binding protein [Chloroflexota bacterium]